MAPEEAGRHHGCGDLSGVNGTPLLRGIEFTHAPSQAGERMAGRGRKGKKIYTEGAEGEHREHRGFLIPFPDTFLV